MVQKTILFSLLIFTVFTGCRNDAPQKNLKHLNQVDMTDSFDWKINERVVIGNSSTLSDNERFRKTLPPIVFDSTIKVNIGMGGKAIVENNH